MQCKCGGRMSLRTNKQTQEVFWYCFQKKSPKNAKRQYPSGGCKRVHYLAKYT